MDDFDALYQDELEALQDMEDGPDDKFIVKGKKSLDFSTPSTQQRSQSKRGIGRSQQDESLLLGPLENSIEEADENVFPVPQGKRKRNQNEAESIRSDEDTDKENQDDIEELTFKSRKRPKLATDQPIPDEFDITPPSSPEPAKSSKKADFQSTSFESYKSQATSFEAGFRKEKSSLGTRGDSTQNVASKEKMIVEEQRLTQNYDFDRKRVLRRIPFERDFISVTNETGGKFYMELRDEEVIEPEVAAREWSHSSLSFLGVPVSVLRAQIQEDKSAQELLSADARMARLTEHTDDLSELPSLCDMREVPSEREAIQESLWVDKYSPHRYTQLLSDESTNRLLLRWLKLWDTVVFGRERKPSALAEKQAKKKAEQQKQHKFFNKFAPEVIEELDNHHRPMQKVALLCGPPGLGKTTLGHVIAQHAGYNVVEMNASDDRSAEVFKTKIESAIQMRSVLEADPRPNCLVIDEIDGAPVAAINILLNVIKSSDAASEGQKKKKRRGGLLLRPIICICNDLYAPALRQLRQHALVVNFPTTDPTKLAGRLLEIAKIEDTKADLSTLLALCEKAENDIRSCINTLQFVKGRGRELTSQTVHSMSLGQKDVNKSLLSVWKHVFTEPRQKQKRYVNPYDRASSSGHVMELEQVLQQNNTSLAARFQSTLHVVDAAGEREKILNGLFENYLLPKIKDPRMDSLLQGNEWIGFQDLLDKQIMTSQNYTLMRYTSYISVAFHLLFASTTPFRLQYPQGSEIHTKLQRSENLVTSMLTDVAPSVRRNLNVNVTVMEFLPPLMGIIQPSLRPVNTQLYSAREKGDLLQLISTMIAYNIQYRQERTEDGQYTYVLEPNVESLVSFPEMKQKKQLTYAMKQLIAREVELERMRRSEWKDEDVPQQTEKTEPIKKDQKESKEKSKNDVKELPNYKKQSLQPKAIKETTSHARDFFGRKIEKKVLEARKEMKKEEKIGGEIWFCFKEGFSNAVRRTVRVKEFM